MKPMKLENLIWYSIGMVVGAVVTIILIFVH